MPSRNNKGAHQNRRKESHDKEAGPGMGKKELRGKKLNQQLQTVYVKQDIDGIKTVKSECRQTVRKLHTPVKMPVKQNCRYCVPGHPHRQRLQYREKCTECDNMNHPREACRSKRGKVVHNVEQESNLNQEEKIKIDMVNVNSISFNSECSIITANLKTSNLARMTIPYKEDTGSDGNIMPLHVYKELCPRATKKQLAAMINTNFQLKTCVRTMIILYN